MSLSFFLAVIVRDFESKLNLAIFLILFFFFHIYIYTELILPITQFDIELGVRAKRDESIFFFFFILNLIGRNFENCRRGSKSIALHRSGVEFSFCFFYIIYISGKLGQIFFSFSCRKKRMTLIFRRSLFCR